MGVIARTDDGVPHNTVTPIARRVDSAGHAGGDRYELCLALRCNIATDEHPWAFSTRTPSTTTSKRRTSALSRSWGWPFCRRASRTRWPPSSASSFRVPTSASPPNRCSTGSQPADATASHAAWAAEVYATRHDEIGADSTHDIVLEEVGIVFGHALENAGVFKWDGEGRAAQQRFIGSL